jgi:CheY-like chemotaxis protein
MSEKRDEGIVVNEGLHVPRSQVPVLVVDDDADFRALMRAYLPPEEFLVKEAADGGTAIHQIQKHQFDLIVLDLVMPEREGLELIPTIRQRCGRSRILAVSGAPKRLLYLKTAGLMGADMTLEKPVTRERFYGCVRQLLLPARTDAAGE